MEIPIHNKNTYWDGSLKVIDINDQHDTYIHISNGTLISPDQNDGAIIGGKLKWCLFNIKMLSLANFSMKSVP